MLLSTSAPYFKPSNCFVPYLLNINIVSTAKKRNIPIIFIKKKKKMTSIYFSML